MPRDVVSGRLLIASAVAGVLVMTFHPTAHDLLNAERFARHARLDVIVHAGALAAAPSAFLGMLGLAHRLGPSHLTTAALVAYGFGVAALLSAAVASGLVAPALIGQVLAADSGSSREVSHALLAHTGLVNQGFAKANVVASSVAVLLWAAPIVQSRRMPRAAGVVGAAIGAGLLLAFFAGYLRVNVHGFGIVTFAQAGWLIWLGILLCREEGESHPA